MSWTLRGFRIVTTWVVAVAAAVTVVLLRRIPGAAELPPGFAVFLGAVLAVFGAPFAVFGAAAGAWWR